MKSKKKSIKIALTVFILLIGLASNFPFLFMISSSFKVSGEVMKFPWHLIPDNPTMMNFKALFTNGIYNFQKWYFNTVVMTALTIAIKIFFVSFTAYGFARIKFRGKDAIFLVLLSAMMIPGDIMIIPRYMIFKNLHILDSMWALILPSCVDVYFVFLLRQSFISIPDSISEAAKIDGCSHLKIYWKIIFPLAKPAIATMALFSFTWSWNDYMGPYLYISTMDKQMLSVGVKLFSSGLIQDYGAQMAAATVVLLPILVAFLFCQKFFIEGVASSGVKG
ncbi:MULTISPECIES: carbohydrate ABC transporter permease [Clostridia]|uniref:Sugar ABC transporter permease n=1 Tax=Lacrimispora celerecrescens TaxID=29354 RepID=A0A084JMY8_9FIRM|nr:MULTISPECIES: carbohydrate ABC transporter permease [Clostridia]KEZ90322.1 sugar ABC transporter permease [Lacrimispora celerecrescens]MSS07772.1 carbohydrate ABC transporter permease [Clostridium sp. WB02_MRS01]CUX28106.1 L-arabinose transport system permease protein AraQ [Clostridium sp. C105KSO15]